MKKGLILGLAGAMLFVAACSADPLSIPNPNSPTVAGASGDAAALQLQATGVLRQLRGGLGGYITSTARFGREGYIYSPNEGRNTSHYLIGLSGANRLDPAGFTGNVTWGGPYGNLRDIFNLKNVITGSATLTAAQKSAGLGFARTIEALELLYVISTRDSLGAVVQINQNASELAPFVSRDSVYRYILGTLNAADAELAAGGAAFPFTLQAGFAGFNTPTTFRQFNRAITARAAVYHATRGGGATAWTQAQTAIAASFLNRTPANAAAMNVGIYHVYSTATGDAQNGVGQNADFLAHPSFDDPTDIETGDLRASKWATLAVARNAPQGLGISTDITVVRYATNTSPVPVIRNEELVLLDAEIRWNTGDKAGSVTNLNAVRSVSGGLAPTAVTAASLDPVFVDELLRQRRYSLFVEGHRWVDHRRFGRLAALPRDLPTGVNAHFVARVIPLPQAECLVRARSTDPLLAGPGC